MTTHILATPHLNLPKNFHYPHDLHEKIISYIWYQRARRRLIVFSTLGLGSLILLNYLFMFQIQSTLAESMFRYLHLHNLLLIVARTLPAGIIGMLVIALVSAAGLVNVLRKLYLHGLSDTVPWLKKQSRIPLITYVHFITIILLLIELTSFMTCSGSLAILAATRTNPLSHPLQNYTAQLQQDIIAHIEQDQNYPSK